VIPPPLSNIDMNQQLQSSSPKTLCFAIIEMMSNELSPLIQRLKDWRTANKLTQAEAVAVFKAGGLPVTLDTLQNWEIGRRTPKGLAAVALSDFLNRHSTITKPRLDERSTR
jgi:DNA-binding transcriptional regulator YiaG